VSYYNAQESKEKEVNIFYYQRDSCCCTKDERYFIPAESYACSTVLFIKAAAVVKTSQSRLLKTITHMKMQGKILKIAPLLYCPKRQKFQEWNSTFPEFHFLQFSVLIRQTVIFQYFLVQLPNRHSSTSKLSLFVNHSTVPHKYSRQ
jgi:hypothetical protein